MPFIALSILILLVLAILLAVFARNQKRGPLSPLASIAFGFIVAGILFGDERVVGYGLMGVGVGLAVADIVFRRQKKGR